MPGSHKSPVKHSKTSYSSFIIIHLIGFLSVLSLILVLSLYQLIRYPNNTPIPLSNWFKLSTFSFITKKPLPSTCDQPSQPQLPDTLSHLNSPQIIHKKSDSDNLYFAFTNNNNWTIAEHNSSNGSILPIIKNVSFPSPSLTKSYQPIKDFLVYPDCSHTTCSIIFYQISNRSSSNVPAIYNIPHPPVTDLHNFFYDETSQIVSYTVNPHPGSDRVILNWQGKILHQIDESPGINRVLSFQYYLPNLNLLVYQDESSGITNYFLANGIGLFRRRCFTLN